MILKPFEYSVPSTLQEACQILVKNEDAKILAGGQSLLPIMKLNLTQVSHLVDLKRIPNLSYIKVEGDRLVVGALATHSEVGSSEVVKNSVPLLAETESSVGHPLVRNRGTIGGSISHCDPAADLCVSSLALGAEMTAVKGDGSMRTIKARDFFVSTFTTALERGEILEKVSFPVRKKGTGYGFEKLTMGHGDFPLIVVSTVLKMEGKKCIEATLALGGVSDRAIRVERAENALNGKELNADVIDAAAKIAEEESKPESDIDVSGEYKKKMVRVFARRALNKAVERSAM